MCCSLFYNSTSCASSSCNPKIISIISFKSLFSLFVCVVFLFVCSIVDKSHICVISNIKYNKDCTYFRNCECSIDMVVAKSKRF